MAREIEFNTWTDQEKEEKRQAMIDVAKNGGFNAAYTVALGLKSEDTFYRWKREIPEFAEWCKEADLHSKVYLEQLAIDQIAGKCKGNATSLAIILRNKFGDEYKNPAEGSSKSETNTTNNYLILSKDDVKEKIAQQIAQLKLFGEAPDGLIIDAD